MATRATNHVVEVQEKEIKYFQKVLNDLVSLNSLFTVGVFIGLSLATPGQVLSLEGRPECNSDTELRKRLVQREIVSFSGFVFSGFLANTVKIFLYTFQSKEMENPHKQGFTLWSFYLSIFGTVLGCLFLLLAMVDVVQLKIGKMSCGSTYATETVNIMIGLIVPALSTYFAAVMYGMFTTAGEAIRESRVTQALSIR